MFSFFRKIFAKSPPVEKGFSAAQQKEMLKSGNPADLKALAENKGTHPEILYFLAKSEDPAVRRAVAVNAATPVQASTLLANDRDIDVRLALAARLLELLPDLTPDRHSQLYAYAVQALGLLAQDEVMKIRRALATTLKDYAKAPPTVAGKLARDVEREVAEPVLRFCVALSDEDMLDILSDHPEPWVVSAIAGRPEVSQSVADAVVETEDVPATTVLVSNSGADFSIATLQKIIDRARNYPEWHKPIAMRKELSLDLAQQLSGFVDAVVLDVLEKRSDFDAATRQGIVAVVRRRLDYHKHGAPYEPPQAKVERLLAEKKLTADVLLDALSWQETDFLHLALSHLCGVHPVIVKKMLGAGSARPVIALCWKGRIPMRVCIELQRQASKLQPKQMIYAKNGTDYPMAPEEIKWQLEFFGISL